MSDEAAATGCYLLGSELAHVVRACGKAIEQNKKLRFTLPGPNENSRFAGHTDDLRAVLAFAKNLRELGIRTDVEGRLARMIRQRERIAAKAAEGRGGGGRGVSRQTAAKPAAEDRLCREISRGR